MEGVPALTPEDHNAARRFITLIDVWYDRGKELPPLAATRSVQHSPVTVEKLSDVSKNTLELLFEIIRNPIAKSMQDFWSGIIYAPETQQPMARLDLHNGGK